MQLEDLLGIFRGRRVLFITPSDVEYIRNKQEITLLKGSAECLDIIGPPNTREVSPTGLKRILRILVRALSADYGKYDVIFVGGIPQAIVPFIRFLFRDKILIIDFFISSYDTIVFDRKVLAPSNPASLVLKFLDRFTLAMADYAIVDTREHARYFSEMFRVDPEKMSVLYIEADSDIYHPRAGMRPQDLEDRFLVFFFGAMNPLQGVEVILEAARLLEDDNRIVFMLVGPYEKIADFALYSKLSNVRFVSRWLPQTEIADYIAMSDVCLAGHFSAEIAKSSRVIPGKAYSYLAMDRAVIFGDNLANRELFSEESRNVHFVKMGDPESLANLILRLMTERKGLKHA